MHMYTHMKAYIHAIFHDKTISLIKHSRLIFYEFFDKLLYNPDKYWYADIVWEIENV